MSKGPNIGHYHEALDRAHTINVMIEELLVDHPAIMPHKDLIEALDELQEAGANLYQAIGVYFHAAEASDE